MMSAIRRCRCSDTTTKCRQQIILKSDCSSIEAKRAHIFGSCFAEIELLTPLDDNHFRSIIVRTITP